MIRKDRENFTVTVLPDDPRLKPSATRERQVKGSKAWRRARYTPRAVNGRHETHQLTVVDERLSMTPKGW
jgi:hypothetical protein